MTYCLGIHMIGKIYTENAGTVNSDRKEMCTVKEDT